MTMCVDGTPVEHMPGLGLYMKREDLSCPGGPDFSKTRGVWTHIAARPEHTIGVLDTVHSQGGWAVAKACALLGKRCVEFYPVRKATPGWRGVVQDQCELLGAQLTPLAAGRSAILYHQARKALAALPDSYMMPNALKLPEMITETAAEVMRTTLPPVNTVLVSASSGTIAAGVLLGLENRGWSGTVVVHQGYSRPEGAMRTYMAKAARPGAAGVGLGEGGRSGGVGDKDTRVRLVDEGYGYSDEARPCGVEPPCPMNKFYDRKLFSWWVRVGRGVYGEALMWNIG